MGDPITLGELATTLGGEIQGNINRDTANRQTEAIQRGLGNAYRTITEGKVRAGSELTGGVNKAIDTLTPFYSQGMSAGQEIFNIATGVNPLASDPMLLQEMQLANQIASARGSSLSPSFQAETMAKLIPGVATRKAALLSPIFSAGYGAGGTIAGLQSGLGANLASLENEYAANVANLGLKGTEATVSNIGYQTPQISSLIQRGISTLGGVNWSAFNKQDTTNIGGYPMSETRVG